MSKERKPYVDFREIRSRITMEQVLAHYQLLDTFKRKGPYLFGPCPIHRGISQTQFRVNVETNLWNCFSECEHDGNALDFISRMEKRPIHDAAMKACEWFGIPLDEVSTGNQALHDNGVTFPKAERPAQVSAINPEPVKPNPPLKFRLEKLQREHPYLTENRGLSLETIIDFGLGFSTGSRGMMAGRIVIPIHDSKGAIVAYAGRWPGESPDPSTPKYAWPPGFRKSQELFNLDRASKEPAEKPMVVVSGFFDAFKLHQHGCRKVVAVMDLTMSAAQEALIRQHTSQNGHVILMLGENALGQVGGDDIGSRLARHCFVKIQSFAPNAKPKDLMPEQLRQLIQQSGL